MLEELEFVTLRASHGGFKMAHCPILECVAKQKGGKLGNTEANFMGLYV